MVLGDPVDDARDRGLSGWIRSDGRCDESWDRVLRTRRRSRRRRGRRRRRRSRRGVLNDDLCGRGVRWRGLVLSEGASWRWRGVGTRVGVVRGRCKEGWRGVNVRGWRRREGRRAMRVGVKGGRQNYLWVFGIGRRCRRRKVLRGQLVVQRLRRRLNRRNDGSLATIPWFLWINLSENFFPQSSDHWRVEKCPTSCPTPSSLGFDRFD